MDNAFSLARISHRLRNDWPLASVASLALTAVFAILPFAIYRLVRGQWLIAVIDLLVVACFILPLLHALASGRNRPAFRVILVGGILGCVAVAHLAGLAGNFWMFPFIIALFALLPLRSALLTGWMLAALVLWLGSGLDSVVDRLSFAVTAFLVCGLAAITAHQVGKQRLALELSAATDPLTGVGNRRRMDAELHDAVALAGRGGPLPAALVLDLDHFKRVNDRCGHDAGDRVLVDFAGILRQGLRHTDRVYRMGGEEFLILLPLVEPTALPIVAEKLRARVSQQLRSPLGPVTASIGAALYRRGESLADWLARADAAVYAAKSAGRDGFVVAPDAPLAAAPPG